MAIDFNKIPTENPSAVPPSGYYKFKVLKAEMKTPGEKAKNTKPYLNMTLALTNVSGHGVGQIYDALRDTDQANQIYKIGRLTTAIGLALVGSIELRDLAKLVPGKEGVCEVENSEDFRDKDKPQADRRRQAQVKMYGSDSYWPLADWTKLVVPAEAAPAEDGDYPFDVTEGKVEVPTEGAAPQTDTY